MSERDMRKSLRRALLLTTGLALFIAPLAGRANPEPSPYSDLKCFARGLARGTLHVNRGPSGYSWTLDAHGICRVTPGGPYLVSVSGYNLTSNCLDVALSPYGGRIPPLLVTTRTVRVASGESTTSLQAWYFDVDGFGPVSRVRIYAADNVPSCYSPVIGGKIGDGVILRPGAGALPYPGKAEVDLVFAFGNGLAGSIP
jgi:hypothetical protein